MSVNVSAATQVLDDTKITVIIFARLHHVYTLKFNTATCSIISVSFRDVITIIIIVICGLRCAVLCYTWH